MIVAVTPRMNMSSAKEPGLGKTVILGWGRGRRGQSDRASFFGSSLKR